MSDVLQETPVEESTPQELSTAPETPKEEKAGEMPPEERSRQAARRRAAQETAKALKADAREEQLRQEVLSHPLVQEAMSLLEETRFRQDLDRVRTAYPQLTANRPDEVGEVYCRLMATGQVDPVVAYEAQVAADRRREPALGDMVSAKAAGGDALYYSSDELDRLTDRDLRDPGIFRKAMESLKKLR